MSRRAVSLPPQAPARPAPAVRVPMAPVRLPEPVLDSSSSLERCLRMRRSCRDFRDAPIPVRDLSQVLWAAQGVTGLGGLRTAPSPGALFALRPYVIASKVAGLPCGVYRFDPESHELIHVSSDDMRPALEKAAGGQQCVGASAAILLLAANYARVSREYGAKAERLVHIEAGHVGQNVCLEATALGLGVIGLGAFDETAVKAALKLPSREDAVYMLAFGWKY